MRAFHAAKKGLEKHEIAAWQLRTPRLTDVHELFEAMKDHV